MDKQRFLILEMFYNVNAKKIENEIGGGIYCKIYQKGV